MLNFLSWYLLISLTGLVTFPLAWRLFPALADRGYNLSRAFGLLLWGFVFWLMTSLGMIENNPDGLGLSFCLLLGSSGLIAYRTIVQGRSLIVNWMRSNRHMLITSEVLFFLTFAGWTFVRACNPEITSAGGEKTMEVAFINAIMRSTTFPPHDPWLSGHAISYYYFGYVLTAMLAKASGVTGGVAHNLMLALVFGLSASGAYGIIYNLLTAWRVKKPAGAGAKKPIGLPLLGPLFLLIASNLEGFLEILHAHGLFWPSKEGTFNFWIWLDIQNLNQAPVNPGQWPPRFYWWWRASRVIQDFDLVGNSQEIIDEFPFFSYLLGDLHPHVLAMPFVLLAIGLALNLFLGGWDVDDDKLGFKLPLQWKGVLCSGVVLGGLAFLNTWDILALTAVLLGAFLIRRVSKKGWSWARLEELLTLAFPIGLLCVLFYLPFFLGFSSQAGGLLPNLVSPTRGIQLWVMFGVLFIPIFIYLIHLCREMGRSARWLTGFLISSGLILLLWGFSWLLGWITLLIYPDLAWNYLHSQEMTSIGELFISACRERVLNSAGLVTLLMIIGLALTHFLRRRQREDVDDYDASKDPSYFVVLLILLGGLLVLVPEFVYLRDNFGWRMNTIFKFFFQGWEFWSLAAAFGTAVMLLNLKRVRRWLFVIGMSLVISLALVYPILGLLEKTSGFQIANFAKAFNQASIEGDPAPLRRAAKVWTLDGSVQFQRDYPADALAVAWLQSTPLGVVAEAVGPHHASYVDFAHISTYSGLPTVMGWIGHEGQWRGTYEGFSQREEDIRDLYETNSWDKAQAILDRYDIRYVFIGTLERSNYRIREEKFQQHLRLVFENNGVMIYFVP